MIILSYSSVKFSTHNKLYKEKYLLSISLTKMPTQEIEHLYTQKLYPTLNSDDFLEFRILPNSKGQIDLSNVLLHFTVTAPAAADVNTKIVEKILKLWRKLCGSEAV